MSCRSRGGNRPAAAFAATARALPVPRRRGSCTASRLHAPGALPLKCRVSTSTRVIVPRAPSRTTAQSCPGVAPPLGLPAVAPCCARPPGMIRLSRRRRTCRCCRRRARRARARPDRSRPAGEARPNPASRRRRRAAARRRRRERCAGARASPSAAVHGERRCASRPRRPLRASGASPDARSDRAPSRARPATQASIEHDSGKLPVKCAVSTSTPRIDAARAELDDAPVVRLMKPGSPGRTSRRRRVSQPSIHLPRSVYSPSRQTRRLGLRTGVPSARRTRRSAASTRPPSRSDARSTRSVKSVIAHSSCPQAPPRDELAAIPDALASQVGRVHDSAQAASGIRRELVALLQPRGIDGELASGSQTTRSASHPARSALCGRTAGQRAPARRSSSAPGRRAVRPRVRRRPSTPPASATRATRCRPTRARSRRAASSSPAAPASDRSRRDRCRPIAAPRQSARDRAALRIGGAHLNSVAPSGISSAANVR